MNSTLPFGWKNFSYVYQSIGLASLSYLRSYGFDCLLYIDDRLVGERFSQKRLCSITISQRTPELRRRSEESSLYCVCRVLVLLGYNLGLKKSVSIPSKRYYTWACWSIRIFRLFLFWMTRRGRLRWSESPYPPLQQRRTL